MYDCAICGKSMDTAFGKNSRDEPWVWIIGCRDPECPNYIGKRPRFEDLGEALEDWKHLNGYDT